MGSVRWVGSLSAISQVGTVTVTGNDVASTYKLLCGDGSYITSLGNSGGVNSTASDLASAWNNSAYAAIQEVQAAAASAVITFTARVAGVPFTVTSSVSGGAGTIGAYSAVTANQSPNDLNAAGNWDTGVLPTNGDDVFFDNYNVPVKWNLGSLSAITLSTCKIAALYTADIGLPATNPRGYTEWRSTELAIGITTLTLGYGTGSGMSRFKWNAGTIAFTATVQTTASGAESNLEAVLIRGTHAANTLSVNGGSVGVGVFNGQSAKVLTYSQTSGTVRMGSNMTLGGTFNVSGGTLQTNSGTIATLNLNGGQLTVYAGLVTTANINSGTMTYRSPSTIVTLTVGLGAGGTVDFSQDNQARTVTSTTMYAGSALNDPSATVTFTNPIAVKTSLRNVTLNVGSGRNYAIS